MVPGTSGDLLALFVEDFEMGVELEVEVGKVDEQQDDGGAAGEAGNVGLGRVRLELKDGGDNDGGNGKSEERGGGLGDGGVEVLLGATKTTKEEAEAHDEQEIGKNGADKRGLDNDNLVLDEGNDGDNELDGVAKGGVDETAEGLAGAQGDFLRGKAQHGSEGDDGDKVDDKDDGAINTLDIVEGDTYGGGDEENVDPGAEKGALELVGDGKGLLGVDGTVEGRLVVFLFLLVLGLVVLFFQGAVGGGGARVVGLSVAQAGSGAGGRGGAILDGAVLVVGDPGGVGVVVGVGRLGVGSLLGRGRGVAEMSAVAVGVCGALTALF